jgi:DNA-binding XRE family transcriptional regulator
MQVYSPEEVLKRVKFITKDHYDNDLAKRLGISKQSLSQYKNKVSIDVQLRIISLLIAEIEEITSKSGKD